MCFLYVTSDLLRLHRFAESWINRKAALQKYIGRRTTAAHVYKAYQCYFSHQKPYMDWLGFENRSPRWQAGNQPPESWHHDTAQNMSQLGHFQSSSPKEKLLTMRPLPYQSSCNVSDRPLHTRSNSSYSKSCKLVEEYSYQKCTNIFG